LSEVIGVLEGSLSPIACLDEPNGCGKPGFCPQREVWEAVRDATRKILDSATVGDLAAREREAGDVGGRYVI
jgi:DNA-binding IscR family transcriptional regulator